MARLTSTRFNESLIATEQLDFTVLVDNQTDSLSSVPSFVTQEFDNLQGGKLEELSGCCLCCAQHGLSLLIELSNPHGKKTVLFDTGPEGYALRRNVDRLGISLSHVQAVVLSHGHWDHGGGLETAFALIDGNKVPLFVNAGMFVKRGVKKQSGIKAMAELSSLEKLESLGAQTCLTDSNPTKIVDECFFLSGEIPRVISYEEGFIGHMKWNEKDQTWDPDPLILDERYLAVHIKSKGLLIFTACSHAGVINVLEDAKARFPEIPLYGVVGGFHLAGKAMENRIDQTIADLKRFNLRLIVPAHCTGWRATAKLHEIFGDTIVVPSAIGRRFQLSACDNRF